jgi:hypothetical protein
VILLALATLFAQDLPPAQRAFVDAHCMDCHSARRHKGDVVLETVTLDWERPETAALLEQVTRMIASGDMPPDFVDPPPEDEKAAMLTWLEGELDAHATLGGTVLRRLNRIEYELSVRDLFGLKRRVPAHFPLDTESHGFDTVGAALVISPPLMKQYVEVATWVADECIKLAVPEALEATLAGSGFEGNPTGRMSDRRRLINAIEVMAWSAARAERFLAPYDGRYRITLTASAFGALENGPHLLDVRARHRDIKLLTPFDDCRSLATFELSSSYGEDLTFEAELLEGEMVVMQFANSPLAVTREMNVTPETIDYLRAVDPDFFDAMIAVGYDTKLRREQNYERVVRALAEGFEPPTVQRRDDYVTALTAHGPSEYLAGFRILLGERFMEYGPALDVHRMHVVGPVGPLRQLTRWLPPRAGQSDREYAEGVLRPLLRRAFRRDVDDATVERHVALALEHARAAGTLEHGLHLALRAVLSSPSFLYRERTSGTLDDFDLAARLSYFLFSTTPDDQLLGLAADGALSDPERFRALVDAMIDDERASWLARNFTGQWLWTRKLDGIMPDERLYPLWHEYAYAAIKGETELFFLHVLREDLPLETFLDADFTFANQLNAAIYGLPPMKGMTMRRVDLTGTARRGGILGQAAVMMATANGVDTSPVIRGVWLLDNVLGDPPAPPPDNVPALTPDATGARTFREEIALHRADSACARCHDKIDPLGFTLENYDAIGAWRDAYPRLVTGASGESEVVPGKPVDSAGVLPDGTTLEGVAGLRRYLLDNRERFARCLTEKLLVYGTGRPLGRADRHIVDEIVARGQERGHGFRELLHAIVTSDSFRTK